MLAALEGEATARRRVRGRRARVAAVVHLRQRDRDVVEDIVAARDVSPRAARAGARTLGCCTRRRCGASQIVVSGGQDGAPELVVAAGASALAEERPAGCEVDGLQRAAEGRVERALGRAARVDGPERDLRRASDGRTTRAGAHRVACTRSARGSLDPPNAQRPASAVVTWESTSLRKGSASRRHRRWTHGCAMAVEPAAAANAPVCGDLPYAEASAQLWSPSPPVTVQPSRLPASKPGCGRVSVPRRRQASARW